MTDKRLPNFFILGAAKAGTTFLYHCLKRHPQIYLPNVKEPHFFENDNNYAKGLDVYLDRYFRNADGYSARGEASPGYFHWHKKVIPRLLEVYGENPPKFIILLRDPVKRAWSHYLHKVRNTLETESFEHALELEQARLRKDEYSWVGYYSDGLYAKQIEAWFRRFPRDRFLIILNEDLRSKTECVMKEIFEFLEVSSLIQVEIGAGMNVASETRSKRVMSILFRPSILKLPFKLLLTAQANRRIRMFLINLNLRPYEGNRPRMNDGVEKELRERYQDDILRLEKLINRDLSSWLNR